MAACTRVRGRATVIGFGEGNPITLLHELGHQAGLTDERDPRSLMYAGRPVRRVGTGLKAAEIAHFRHMLSTP